MISDLHINDCSEPYLKEIYHRIDRMIKVILGQIDPMELLIVSKTVRSTTGEMAHWLRALATPSEYLHS